VRTGDSIVVAPDGENVAGPMRNGQGILSMPTSILNGTALQGETWILSVITLDLTFSRFRQTCSARNQ
jgi:hypothetical protein